MKAKNYGLYHFHIDAFNDNICMNKFEATNDKNSLFGRTDH